MSNSWAVRLLVLCVTKSQLLALPYVHTWWDLKIAYLLPEVEEYEWPNNDLFYQHDSEVDSTLGQPVVKLKWITCKDITHTHTHTHTHRQTHTHAHTQNKARLIICLYCKHLAAKGDGYVYVVIWSYHILLTPAEWSGVWTPPKLRPSEGHRWWVDPL